MGDPKKQRKKYGPPSHPWQKERIEAERGIFTNYGLKNKREIWKMQSGLKKITSQIKKLIGMPPEKSAALTADLQKKLIALGLLKEAKPLEEAMNLTLHDIMDRRLQTMVYKKGLARSVRQARQFVVHEHILVGGKKVTAPSYIVPVSEEPTIGFAAGSSLSSLNHPERAPLEKPKKQKAAPIREGRRNERKNR